MSDVPLSKFTIGEHTRGFAAPLGTERVGLNFIAIGGPTVNMTMSATEARAVANALYEADAAEKLLPVAAPAPVAA